MFCGKLPNTVGQILVLRFFHIMEIIKISATKRKKKVKCVIKPWQLSPVI